MSDTPRKSRTMRAQGLPAGPVPPWDICLFFKGFTVAGMQFTSDAREVHVYFVGDPAEKAAAGCRDRRLGAAELEPSCISGRPTNTQGVPFICLFDIMAKSIRDRWWMAELMISEQDRLLKKDQGAAVEAGIFPGWERAKVIKAAGDFDLDPPTWDAVLKEAKGDEEATKQRFVDISSLLKSAQFKAQGEPNARDSRGQRPGAGRPRGPGAAHGRRQRQLMGILDQGFDVVKELLCALYPKNINFTDEAGLTTKFELSRVLHKEGRPTWNCSNCCLVWNQGKFGGSRSPLME